MERWGRTSRQVTYLFNSTAEAEAAVAALRREDIPASVTPTETGPVVVLNERYQERAERRVPALLDDL